MGLKSYQIEESVLGFACLAVVADLLEALLYLRVASIFLYDLLSGLLAAEIDIIAPLHLFNLIDEGMFVLVGSNGLDNLIDCALPDTTSHL